MPGECFQSLLMRRNQILRGCVARSIETTGAAIGLDKVGLNCPKVHRNLSYGTWVLYGW